MRRVSAWTSFEERRSQLASAAVLTLSELGYARTSLREIAQNSEFSHGVLHYYFRNKHDLIICCVRHYKERCVTRYDKVLEDARTYENLLAGFVAELSATLRDEAHLHRLWYDLRNQALFDEALRPDVADIDESLMRMIWRIVHHLQVLADPRAQKETAGTSPGLVYAAFDGVFQQCLLRNLSGDATAILDLKTYARTLAHQIAPPAVKPRGSRKG